MIEAKKEILGVDIGGVIISRVGGQDTSFIWENHLATEAVADAFKVLHLVMESKRFGNVFLISKCKKRTQEMTLEWLAHQGFYQKVGIGQNCVYFCEEHHQKLDICQELGVTHFVDDRLKVLGHLIGKVRVLYLFQSRPTEVAKYPELVDRVIKVESWNEVRTCILNSKQ